MQQGGLAGPVAAREQQPGTGRHLKVQTGETVRPAKARAAPWTDTVTRAAVRRTTRSRRALGPRAVGEALMAKGLIRLKKTTTSDLDRIPRYDFPSDASPLEVILAERDADQR